LHALGGKLSGMQAISLTPSYRLTSLLKITQEEIILLHVGTHDDTYR